uniref:Uncharacterized protein n=1 Tax=Amphimedon queenslandica TaxID=400682 RepID=A0A1X7SM55_AMPQE
MDRLLNELKDAITFDGSIFPWLVEILNDYDTVTSRGVANKLIKDYNETPNILITKVSLLEDIKNRAAVSDFKPLKDKIQ